MSALSIQSSSVAVVIASDDDGGGQRYIRAVAMSALSIQSSVLPPSLPATTTAAVKGIFGAAMSGPVDPE
jgi:magnesium-transporting ATPase (P-type)